MSPSTAQHTFTAAKARAGIQKPGSIHLDTPSPRTFWKGSVDAYRVRTGHKSA
jgi:hypothetical protein